MPAQSSPRASIFGNSGRDAWVLAGAALYAVVVLVALVAGTRAELSLAGRFPFLIVLAVGMCWAANTVSHIQLHTPIFGSRGANRLFALTLTLALGIPQTWWKRRHFRHHDLGDDAGEGALGAAAVAVEATLLLGAWVLAALFLPAAFFGVYLPAWVMGLGLCATQGHYEHLGGAAWGVDYHGPRYNRWWFNDGYHVHHHREPTAHWTTLASPPSGDVPVSAWPPLLRWLGRRAGLPRPARAAGALAAGALDYLERRTLNWRPVRWFLLLTHGKTLGAMLADWQGPLPRRVCIVGGGLYPRTAILFRRLLPEAALTVVDAEAAHLHTAARLLDEDSRGRAGGTAVVDRVTLVHDRYGEDWSLADAESSFDLLVVPLAFRGDRERLYRSPRAAHVLIHDWMWRRRGVQGRLVSPLLLKRINLVRRPSLAQVSAGRARRSSSNLDTLAASNFSTNENWLHPCRTIALPLMSQQPASPPVSAPASTTTWWRDFARAIGRPS